MNRPPQKLTPEQAERLEAAIATTRAADQSVEAGWKAILAACEAGVPDDVVCKRTGWSRATLNRKYGPRKDRKISDEPDTE